MSEYFNTYDLDKFNNGDLADLHKEHWNNFLNYYGNIMGEGKLSVRTKALIALASLCRKMSLLYKMPILQI